MDQKNQAEQKVKTENQKLGGAGHDAAQDSKSVDGGGIFDAQILQEEIAKAMQQIQDENDEREKNRNGVCLGVREQIILRDYYEAEDRLLHDKSKKNYRDMMAAFHQIVLAWDLLKGIDDFDGAVQKYEKTVLEYWEQFQTEESLYRVAYFYSNSRVLKCLDSEDDTEAYLKRGIPYVESYHKMEDSDYSACLCIDVYLELGISCEPGEEGLGYIRKACSFAEKCTEKYRTLQMLDKYQEAVWTVAAYYRLCYGDEEAAERKEQEYKETAERLGEMLA